MDLIGGYLLVVIILFSANLALMLGNFRIDNIKLAVLSAMLSAICFALMNISSYLNAALSFLLFDFSYLFLIVSIVMFLVMLFCVNRNRMEYAISFILIIFIIMTAALASQSDLTFNDIVLYSIVAFIVLFGSYQLSKLLVHAKRQYPVIISEFMCLSAILMFIFALTYFSTMTLDYSQFSPFLILTPTYQLIYMIIGLGVVMIIGLLLNESKGGNS